MYVSAPLQQQGLIDEGLCLLLEGRHYPGHGEEAAVLSEEELSLWGAEKTLHCSWRRLPAVL